MSSFRLPLSLFALISVATFGCSKRDGATTDSAAGAAASPSATAGADTSAARSPSGGTMAMLDVTKLPGGAEYLTDTDGRSLYMFEKDKPDRSTCFDACAATWPPVTTSGSPMAHNAGIDEKRLGTIRRPDGTMQVTYDHKPLYYYAQDKAAGDIKGQDLNQFGADWYLVKPDGKKQEAKK